MKAVVNMFVLKSKFMKRIESIKHILKVTITISIITIFFLFSCKRYNNDYKIDTQTTLEKITNSDYLISLDEILDTSYVLIDVRNPIEFEKGHLGRAINKYAPELLNEENTSFFDDQKARNKVIVLYGKNPNEVTAPFMLLYQLGYNNIKILSVENYFLQNELITKNIVLEQLSVDINAFIAESKIKAAEQEKPQIIRPVKRVVPVKKKKKIPIEGGC